MKDLAMFICGTLQNFIFNYTSRKKLLTLSDKALQDIGLTYEEAIAEGNKPFWKGGAYRSMPRQKPLEDRHVPLNNALSRMTT